VRSNATSKQTKAAEATNKKLTTSLLCLCGQQTNGPHVSTGENEKGMWPAEREGQFW